MKVKMFNRAILKLHRRCNNNCIFCHSYKMHGPELDVQHILNKLELAYNLGVNQILFSGGEPTLYPEIIKLISLLNSKSLYSGFISNGRMFSYKDFLNSLITRGARYFYISLHAPDPETHDVITECPGSWEQTTRGLLNLNTFSSDIELWINCVITNVNIEHLANMVRYISKMKLNAHLKFSYPEPKGRVASTYHKVVPKMKEAGLAISTALKLAGELGVDCFYDGLPFCFLDPLFRFRVNNLESSRIFYMSETSEKRFFRTDESLREKADNCFECSHDQVCTGFYAGYNPSGVSPIIEQVPNYFNLWKIGERQISLDDIDLCDDISSRSIPFKRIAVHEKGQLKIYEAADTYFRSNSFTTAKKLNQIYVSQNVSGSSSFSLNDLVKLAPIKICADCLKECPGVYEKSGNEKFMQFGETEKRALGTVQGKVLDVGFGERLFSLVYFQESLDNITYYGIEPDQELFNQALEQADHKIPRVRLFNTTLEKFEFQDNFFDFVIMPGSFNHIEGIQTGLRVIKRVLQKSGRLIILENTIFGLLNDNQLPGRFYSHAPGIDKSFRKGYEHYRNCYCSDALKVVRKAGFEILAARDIKSTGYNFWMLMCRK